MTAVGAYSAAARLLGAVTRPDQTPTYGEESERLSISVAVLQDNLGDVDFARERDGGSGLDLASAGRAAVKAIRDSL